ncbi:MAG: hypothetical protein RLZ98_3086 [Pseudomonadota bacterium]|jgi:predicted MFS family arabinose efflux permease
MAVVGFTRREGQVLGLVCTAHMLSHLYLLAWAPLLPLITRDLNISYAEFGLALSVFAVVTGICQTPMGLLVERIGGRLVLMGGLCVNALCIVLIGLYADNFWTLALLMAVAGVGNAVFHPADYSLLSSSIGEGRMGKAFSIHTFVGNIGFIIGPIVTAALEPVMGWRGAVVAIGGAGLVTALALIAAASLLADGSQVKKSRPISDSLRELLSSPAVLLFFVFYLCTSFGNVGITQFSIVALQDMYGIDRALAVVALTAYQVGALALVLPGGVLADKVTRYDLIILVGFAITALAILLAGSALFPFFMVPVFLCLAGAIRGGVNTTRDVAVRRIADKIPVGTVFGFVSTGFLAGQALGGPFYGWLFDHYPPHYVFYVSALVHLLAIATVVLNPGSRRERAAAE